MRLDMTNDSFAEGWFVQTMRTIKDDLEAADKLDGMDPKVAADRRRAALYVAREAVSRYDAAMERVKAEDQRKLEDARQRRAEAEERLQRRRTPLPPVAPDGNSSLVGRDGQRIPLFLQGSGR